jgi:pimeloyl-ACP methyl ester carboxylesterase
MKRCVPIFVLGGLTVCLGLPLLLSAEDIEFKPHVLETFDGRQVEAELGRLNVPESRLKPSRRTIRLAFVRLRSTAPRAWPPIVFLAGGPGVPGNVMGRVPVYLRLFERLRGVSDVILLDQRGTGLSSPNLQCTSDSSLPSDAFENEENAFHALLGAARVCADHWREQGVDLAAYNTDSSADDIEDLRRALGADHLNLLGFSYGTELALAYLRRYGDHVQHAVLAATRGPDQVMKLPLTLDFQLRKLSLLAARDPSVAAQVPDLYGLLKQLLDDLERNPARVPITDRRTGRKVELMLGKVGVQAIVQSRLNDGRAQPGLPALIYTLSRGDYSLLAPIAEQLYNGIGQGISSMTVAVDCSSGWSEWRWARAQSEAPRSLLGTVMNLQLHSEVCALAGSPDLGVSYRSPIWSVVPTLFLSGTLDSGSPPHQAEEVRWGFPNSVHIIVENASHESLPVEEVQAAVVAFFKGEDVRDRRIALSPPRFLSIAEAKAAASSPPR